MVYTTIVISGDKEDNEISFVDQNLNREQVDKLVKIIKNFLDKEWIRTH